MYYKMLEWTPVNTCFAVTCDKCGKTTWRVGVAWLIGLLSRITHRSFRRDVVPTLNQ